MSRTIAVQNVSEKATVASADKGPRSPQVRLSSLGRPGGPLAPAGPAPREARRTPGPGRPGGPLASSGPGGPLALAGQAPR